MLDSIKNFMFGENETLSWIIMGAIALVALLMVVFFIAMLVNHGKAKGNSSAVGNPSAFAALQGRCDELEREDVAKKQKLKFLQERVTELEGKQRGCAEQAQFYEEEFEKIKERAETDKNEVEVLQKQVEALQKENAKLKEKPAKNLTLEEAIDKSVFEEDEPVRPAPRPAPAKSAPASAKSAPAPRPAPAPVRSTPTKAAPTPKTQSRAADDEPSGVYEVVYDQEKEDWVVRKRGNQRATRRCSTKQEAVKVSRELATNQNAGLAIHKKDGKFQKI
ncbi:MAG: DUF2188 domain-containing protein [Firmicutes bacterium]|nr:DUF2188 domain-containing protein [Bacillota bacterium]